MTAIYADPTETRKRTRLPKNVVRQAKELPGLEALTGADLLLAVDDPPDDVRELVDDEWIHSIVDQHWRGKSIRGIAKAVDRPVPFVLRAVKFIKACKTGLLVQRKTGRDLASSVPRLSEILMRMIVWTDKPWLLFVGDLKCNKRGNAVIDGTDTGFSHNAVQGALEAWQYRGGYVTWLSRDNLVMPWCARWLDKLGTIDQEKTITREVVQPIVGPNDDTGRKIAVLAALKHVGKDKARRLLDYYGTLAGALEAVLDPGMPYTEHRPDGFGVTTVVDNRQLFGLTEDWMKLVTVAVEKGQNEKGRG